MGGLIIVASLVAKLLEGLELRCPMLADKPVNSVCLSICLSVSLSSQVAVGQTIQPRLLCYAMLC